jgi:hypothetical protein
MPWKEAHRSGVLGKTERSRDNWRRDGCEVVATGPLVATWRRPAVDVPVAVTVCRGIGDTTPWLHRLLGLPPRCHRRMRRESEADRREAVAAASRELVRA